NAVGQLPEGAQERFVVAGPVGDLHEVVAVGPDATEATEEDIAEAMLEVAALASGIGDGLQLLHQSTGLGSHRKAVQPGISVSQAPIPNPLIVQILKCAPRGLQGDRLRPVVPKWPGSNGIKIRQG